MKRRFLSLLPLSWRRYFNVFDTITAVEHESDNVLDVFTKSVNKLEHVNNIVVEEQKAKQAAADKALAEKERLETTRLRNEKVKTKLQEFTVN